VRNFSEDAEFVRFRAESKTETVIESSARREGGEEEGERETLTMP
jgi:hypothetical protein